LVGDGCRCCGAVGIVMLVPPLVEA
jgi:hypothetical protein